tara:strand:+ start:308 stop:532 length:225 start_codon:yes stop_codon:yes gene_type:complete
MEHEDMKYNFKYFTVRKWEECSSERRSYGESTVQYKDYVEANIDQLKKEYERQNPQQGRKKMDGLNSKSGMYSL